MNSSDYDEAIPRGGRTEVTETVYTDRYLRVEANAGRSVAIATGPHPEDEPTTVVGAAGLRDALDEYLANNEHEVEQSADTTFSVDADVSDASEAITQLTTDVDELTESLNDAVESLERLDLASEGLDYGTPAPSPDDVKARIADTPDEDPRGDSDE